MDALRHNRLIWLQSPTLNLPHWSSPALLYAVRHICDADGNLGVVYYTAERKPYGTREDKKFGGDAEAAAREGGDEDSETL